MKRFVTFSFVLFFMMVFSGTVLAAESVKVNISTPKISLDVSSVTEKGVVMLPVRQLSDELGISATYKGLVKKITYENDDNIMTMIMGNTNAYLNGKRVSMPVAPKIINGAAYVPLEFFVTSMGYGYSFDGATRTANISRTVDPNQTLFKLKQFDYEITKVLTHPTQPIIYNFSQSGCVVEAYNYKEEKSVAVAKFNGTPTAITMNKSGTEIYVSLITSPFSYYGKSEYGEIVVLDALTLSQKSKFSISIDPFSIATDSNGILFVMGGSNQWTKLVAIDIAKKSVIASADMVYMEQNLVYSDTQKMVYSITTSTSPRDITAYIFKDGKFIEKYDSQYHGDYDMGKEMKLLPNQNAIITSKGTIFSVGGTSRTTDIIYKTKIDEYTDVTFDDGEAYIYAADKRSIRVYDAKSASIRTTVVLDFDVKLIQYYKGDLLLMDEKNCMHLLKTKDKIPVYDRSVAKNYDEKAIIKTLDKHADSLTNKKVNDYMSLFTKELESKQDKVVSGVTKRYQAIFFSSNMVQITQTGASYSYDYELTQTLKDLSVEMNYLNVEIIEKSPNKVVVKTAIDIRKTGGSAGFVNSCNTYKVTLVIEDGQWKIADLTQI